MSFTKSTKTQNLESMMKVFDYEVLKMFDFNTYRPVIIQYEHFHLSMEEQINSNRLLAKNGYCILKEKNDTIELKKQCNIDFYYLSNYF